MKVYSYNPEIRIGRQENIQVNKALMKRYCLLRYLYTYLRFQPLKILSQRLHKNLFDLFISDAILSFFIRYYMIQKAKDADVIGIVVGTLGIGNFSCYDS